MNPLYPSNIQPLQGCDIQFILKSNASVVIYFNPRGINFCSKKVEKV